MAIREVLRWQLDFGPIKKIPQLGQTITTFPYTIDMNVHQDLTGHSHGWIVKITGSDQVIPFQYESGTLQERKLLRAQEINGHHAVGRRLRWLPD